MAPSTEVKPQPGGRKITVATAAEILGVDPETVRRYGRDGVIDMINVGRGKVRPSYRVFLVQVQWLDRQLLLAARNRHAS